VWPYYYDGTFNNLAILYRAEISGYGIVANRRSTRDNSFILKIDAESKPRQPTTVTAGATP